MRLDQKRDEEVLQRAGSTKKTVIQASMMLGAFALAYGIASWLFSAGYFNSAMFYSDLGVPKTVTLPFLKGGVACIISLFIQMLLMLGFFLGNPDARRKSGTPTGNFND